jgi:urease alpha subunit
MKLGHQILSSACAIGMTLSLAGCGGSTTRVSSTTQTSGQELIDLQKALDSGAINQKEYDKQRAKILKRE